MSSRGGLGRCCYMVVSTTSQLRRVVMATDGEAPLPTSRSYAAGLRSSRELSSLRGVRHFWQYILGGVLVQAARRW